MSLFAISIALESFSAVTFLIFWARQLFALGGSPVHYRMFSSILGLIVTKHCSTEISRNSMYLTDFRFSAITAPENQN